MDLQRPYSTLTSARISEEALPFGVKGLEAFRNRGPTTLGISGHKVSPHPVSDHCHCDISFSRIPSLSLFCVVRKFASPTSTNHLQRSFRRKHRRPRSSSSTTRHAIWRKHWSQTAYQLLQHHSSVTKGTNHFLLAYG
jgi:hypothetical protein